MNERLKLLRKTLQLSQDDFGKRLRVSNTAISKLEKGERNLTEQMILSICREFNVNEEWLRNGTGERFKESNITLSFNNYKDMILGAVSIMNMEQQKMLWDYIKENFSKEIANE